MNEILSKYRNFENISDIFEFSKNKIKLFGNFLFVFKNKKEIKCQKIFWSIFTDIIKAIILFITMWEYCLEFPGRSPPLLHILRLFYLIIKSKNLWSPYLIIELFKTFLEIKYGEKFY